MPNQPNPPKSKDAKNKDVTIDFHGNQLILHGDGTLFMPAEGLLIVSDLHLEKGAALSHGAPLPAFDTKDTLARLAQRIEQSQPTKLLCLGDSFHTVERAFLLPPDALASLHEIAARTSIIWVTGNHDRNLPDRLPGTACDEMHIGNLRFCHEADFLPLQPTISGHFHPKARIKLRARALSARCFVQNDLDLILPAFGSYTGGLNILDEAFAGFLTANPTIHLIHDNKTFSMPFQKSRFFRTHQSQKISKI